MTYSTDHALIGSAGHGSLAAEAADGIIVSRTSSGRTAGAFAGTKVLETFTPVGAPGGRGAATIVQSYEPIERDAQSALLWVGGVLEGLLFALFVLLVPLLARVSRRIGPPDRADPLPGPPRRSHRPAEPVAAFAPAWPRSGH